MRPYPMRAWWWQVLSAMIVLGLILLALVNW